MQDILLLLSLSGLSLGHRSSPPSPKPYYYVDQKLSWANAQQYCREHYEDLATIDDVVDLRHLQASRTGFDYDNDSMWIGLYDDRTRWKWSFGNQDYKYGQDYGVWSSGNPDFWDNAENCSVLFDGLFVDLGCFGQEYAFCYDDEHPYYTLVESLMTWYEALQYCRSHHTDLAIVRNETELSRVSAISPSNVFGWLGLHREPWSHWSDGSQATFFNWGPGEPNGFGGPIAPRCATVSGTSGHFFDEECGTLYNFACRGPPKQKSTFKLKISSEADMMDPEVEHQMLEQLNVKLAEIGVTGRNISWVLKDGKVFHKDQPSET